MSDNHVWMKPGFESMKGLRNGTAEYQKEYNKCYYRANKQNILHKQYQQVECHVCGTEHLRVNFSHHRRSLKHKRALETVKDALSKLDVKSLTHAKLDALILKLRHERRD